MVTMKKRIAAIITTITALTFSVAHAGELNTFKQVAKAVNSGKKLTYVIHLDKCQTSVPNHDIIVSVKPSDFMIINKKRVTASHQHFSLNQPSAPNEPTITYGKYDIDEYGKASIKVTLMKAIDYSKIKEYELRCELGQGLVVFK